MNAAFIYALARYMQCVQITCVYRSLYAHYMTSSQHLTKQLIRIRFRAGSIVTYIQTINSILTSRNWTNPNSPNSDTHAYAASLCKKSWHNVISSLRNNEPMLMAIVFDCCYFNNCPTSNHTQYELISVCLVRLFLFVWLQWEFVKD